MIKAGVFNSGSTNHLERSIVLFAYNPIYFHLIGVGAWHHLFLPSYENLQTLS